MYSVCMYMYMHQVKCHLQDFKIIDKMLHIAVVDLNAQSNQNNLFIRAKLIIWYGLRHYLTMHVNIFHCLPVMQYM